MSKEALKPSLDSPMLLVKRGPETNKELHKGIMSEIISVDTTPAKSENACDSLLKAQFTLLTVRK